MSRRLIAFGCCCFLTLVGVQCIQITLHELGHVYSTNLGGGLARGVHLTLFPLEGRCSTEYPFLENLPQAELWSHAGGPLVTWILGAIAIGACFSMRRSLWPPMLLLGSVGIHSVGMLFGGLVHDGFSPKDLLYVGRHLGFTVPQVRQIDMVLGGLGVIAFGALFARRMLVTGSEYFQTKTYSQRLSVLIWGAWSSPVLLAGIWLVAIGSRFRVAENLPTAIGLALCSVGAPVLLAIIALFCPNGAKNACRLRPVRALAIGGVGVSFLVLVGQAYAPKERSIREIEQLARSGGVRELRLAAYLLTRSGLTRGNSEKARRWLVKADELQPNNPGTLYLLASFEIASGAAGKGLALLEEASRLFPSNCQIPYKAAEIAKRLGRFRAAAHYYDRAAANCRSVYPAAERRLRDFTLDQRAMCERQARRE